MGGISLLTSYDDVFFTQSSCYSAAIPQTGEHIATVKNPTHLTIRKQKSLIDTLEHTNNFPFYN